MTRSVGIDLGTTHCSLSWVGGSERPQTFEIPQLVAFGDVQARATLPSFLYVPTVEEASSTQLNLPWSDAAGPVLGEAARARGAEVPLRLVSSAKSWLAHDGVDRQAPLLPPGAPPDVEKISPVDASARYLAHLAAAWGHATGERLADHEVLLTVPASFDAVARELTTEAARRAGLGEPALLEEPQAAFYAWLATVGDAWRDVLGAGDVVLVCDVGGGTSDFSLIRIVDDGAGNLELERVAVGDHILLGGDNMDLALAYRLSTELAARGKKLDAAQQRALVQATRRAKEKLLTGDETSAPVTVLGRGSKLIGGKITTELTRDAIDATLLEGFFPACGFDDPLHAAPRTGFVELGLPYAADPAVTRHLAHFLRTHGGGSAVTHVLFNGGVFNSDRLRARVLEVMQSWGYAPRTLEGSDLDLATSRGAAAYGALRRFGGLRIRGGVGRSYYVGMEGAAPAVPGVPPPVRALCVVPRGMEEGTGHDVPGVELGLVVGETAHFRFFTATDRPDDQPGDVLDEFTWPDALTEIAPVQATLPAEGAGELAPGGVVPVQLRAEIDEVGTLRLWSVASRGDGRWQLRYDVRERPAS